MLSREGNAGERWKTTIGLFSKKKQLCTCSSLFLYISLPLFRTTTTWNFQKVLSCTFYGGNVVRVLVHFFFYCHSLSSCIGGCNLFLFCHRRYKIFMLFFQQKNVSFVFFPLALDLCRPFSRWASLACSLTFSFSLSFSCSIFQICGHAGQWI